MSVTFTSGLSPMINAFLDEKHALGYKYEENERYLKNFDSLCTDRFPEIDTVTREAGLAWAIANTDEGKAGLTRRMSSVRELARFIIRSGKDAFIIPPECGKVPYRNYIPYIFSEEELDCLFQAADNFRYNGQFPGNSLEVPVLLRLLYACGLRPYEGRMILRENIDLDKGTIFIPESKKLKDRIVPMDDAMLSLCRKYYEEIRLIFPDNEYFFPCQGRAQHYHNRHWLSTVMRRCLLNAEITDGSGAIAPRPYDLRHTFATHTLYRWLKEGRNLDNCLPYLSAYMGHEKFQHTAYYIHLVPDFFPEIRQLIKGQFDYIIPEVEYEDY